MVILYLIAIVFGVLIFMVFLILYALMDRRARIRVKSRFHLGEKRDHIPWQDRFSPLLDVIKAPVFFDRLVNKEAVTQSGIPLQASQYKSLWWLLVLGGTCLGLVGFFIGGREMGRLVWGTVLILFPAAGPFLYLKWRIRERKREVTRALPDFLDMLTLTVEAGLGFIPALRRVSRGYSGILGEELQRVLAQIELGFSRREALKTLVHRLPSSDVEHFVEAINLSEQLGTSLARTLRIQANLMRTHRRQRAEVQAQTALIRIIPALVFFFLPSLLLIYLAPPIINFLFRR
jgi:tight adherence protein C